VLDIENIMETLIELSEDKYSFLENVYKLTCEQTGAIEEEDIDKLNELIDRKQLEINNIQSSDIKFEKIVDEIKLVYSINSLDELQVCCDEVKRIQYVISMVMNKVKQIREVEIKNRELLSKSKDELEEKMSKLKSGKKAVSGYGYNIQNPVYFDKNK